MRLVDVLARVPDLRTVVDATNGELNFAPYLHLPNGVDLVHDHGDCPIGPGHLAIGVFGPEPRLHGTESDLRRMIRRLRPGAWAVIAVGYPSAGLPYHRLLDDLVTSGGQVLWAVTLDYTHLHGALLVSCTDSLLPGFDWMGRAVPAGPTTVLRRANEYVIADFVGRGVRARLLDAEQALASGQAELSAAAVDAERLAQLGREKDELAGKLRRSRERIELLEARVAMLDSSTSMKVGRALVGAARRPTRGSIGLAHELYGLWRGRRRTDPGRASQSGGRQPDSPTADDALYLAHRSFQVAPPQLVIAGILRRETCDELGTDAIVNRLLPHDGRILVERTQPDAVVVQASACDAAAHAGPWALTGSGGAPDLDRRLSEILCAMRTARRPAILWQDVPLTATPGLGQFDWDVVLELDAGRSPAGAVRAGAGREELRRIFRSDATRLRLSAIARAAGACDPLDRRRVAVIADPRDARDVERLTADVLEQEHRPAEIVVPRPGHGLDELTALGVVVRVGTKPSVGWIADWTDPAENRHGTSYLLDLMCAQESTGADAVGYLDPADHNGTEDYVFVPHVRPALVAYSLHASGLPPKLWSRHGYRLVGIQRAAAA